MHDDITSPWYWGRVLMQLIVAVICGGIVGFERERFDHPAGFRTHVLVCVGSTVYMLVSVAVSGGQYDPGRIAAQVASGIGFLGAGTIIKQGSIVRGLTTAASLWAVAGIGLAVGFNVQTLVIALLGTLVVWVTLSLLKWVEFGIEHRRAYRLTVTVPDPRSHLEWLRALLAEQGVAVEAVSYPEGDAGSVVIEGYAINREVMDVAAVLIGAHDGVREVRWEYR